jgi:hypothetical protein
VTYYYRATAWNSTGFSPNTSIYEYRHIETLPGESVFYLDKTTENVLWLALVLVVGIVFGWYGAQKDDLAIKAVGAFCVISVGISVLVSGWGVLVGTSLIILGLYGMLREADD